MLVSVGPGYNLATFSFSDGAENVQLNIELDGGGGCALVGDANGDSTLNVLDVVLTVNLILSGLRPFDEAVMTQLTDDFLINRDRYLAR